MDRRRTVPWRWVDLLKAVVAAAIIFVAFAVLIGFARAPLRALEADLARAGLSTHVFGLLLSSLVAYGAAIVAIALFIARPYHVRWSTLGFRVVPTSRFAALLVAYPATVVTAGGAMALVARFVLHGNFTNPQVSEIAGGVTRTTPNIVGLLLLTAVMAPIVEETVFRGVLYQWLRNNLPVWGAATVSAAVFAAAHAIPIIFPWLFVTGIALALMFEYCQTLYGSMLLHGLINGVNVVALISTLPR